MFDNLFCVQNTSSKLLNVSHYQLRSVVIDYTFATAALSACHITVVHI